MKVDVGLYRRSVANAILLSFDARGTDDRVDWALVLTGAYAAPLADASSQLEREGVPGPGEVVATYVRDVNVVPLPLGPLGPDLWPPVSAIVGSTSSGSELFLRIPSNVPLTRDLGNTISLDLPVFGTETPYNFDRWEMALEAPNEIADDVRQLLNPEKAWWRPRTRWTFNLRPDQPDERLDAAFPAPARASDWSWSEMDLLDIDAIIGRPAVQAQRETFRFLSGLLLGLAGGFLIWIFELARDVARRHSGKAT